LRESLACSHDELYRSPNLMPGGDPEAVLKMWSEADDVVYAGSFGGFITGRDAEVEAFTAQAAL